MTHMALFENNSRLVQHTQQLGNAVTQQLMVTLICLLHRLHYAFILAVLDNKTNRFFASTSFWCKNGLITMSNISLDITSFKEFSHWNMAGINLLSLQEWSLNRATLFP
jgi:hypothetical protein